jgi:alkylated DNA repair dioxygenase AlkB
MGQPLNRAAALPHSVDSRIVAEPDLQVDNTAMRIALAPGGWLDHEPAWLPRAEADRLLETVRTELEWEQRAIVLFGRPILQPRLIAWAGAVDYRYSGQTLEPRAFTPTLRSVLMRACERAGVAFNHVLANRYRDGRDSMGLHADDERELGADPIVATLTLGATRRFVLKPRRKSAGTGVALDLEHGSLVVMGGTCQRHYVHGVPRQTNVRDERISLTFRHVEQVQIVREPSADRAGARSPHPETLTRI